MSALERLLVAALLVVGLLLGGTWWMHHYGAEQYKAGQAAAVAAGEKLRQVEADRHRETETDLRAQLAARDADAFTKEQAYAENLDAAQRRVRAGTDRLRCPASPVPTGAAAGDRPVAAAPAVDGAGQDLVPEAAADVLGYGAAIASLVSRYGEVAERYEVCRAVNAR